MRDAGIGSLLATMVAAHEPLSPPALADLLRQHYGLEGSLSALTGERDQNVLLRTCEGEAWVLKVAHPDEPEQESDLARAALLHVARTDPAIPCPRVRRTLQGDTRVRFKDEFGAERFAYVVSFLEGRTLAGTPRSVAQREACGRMAGRLARALGGFEHPGAMRRLIWDFSELRCVPLLLAEVEDFPEQASSRALLLELISSLEPQTRHLRRAIVHNDVNAMNVLVDAGDPARISGVIDFGDAVHTICVSDAAVAAAEMIPDDCADPSSARQCARDVLRAYVRERPLSSVEQGVLGSLISARLVTNLVVQQWHRRRNPAGRHYCELEPDFIRDRLDLARALHYEGPGAM